jgi:hypothetical protein
MWPCHHFGHEDRPELTLMQYLADRGDDGDDGDDVDHKMVSKFSVR